MTASALPELDREARAIRDWQEKQLVRLGFSNTQVMLLMSRCRSWHEVKRLRDAGATPEQVVRILS